MSKTWVIRVPQDLDEGNHIRGEKVHPTFEVIETRPVLSPLVKDLLGEVGGPAQNASNRRKLNVSYGFAVFESKPR